MKFTIAPLLLSSGFAKPDSKAANYGKAGKFSKAKQASKSKSAYGSYGSMSASMSVGPEPPITLTGCGESFTNEEVVLSEDLNCGSLVGDRQDCAVTLVGPLAELNCKDKTLSQEATSAADYNDGPFSNGICLSNGAKASKCNVQRFNTGISVTNGGEVVNSNLGSNNVGIFAEFTEDSNLTIEDT